VNEYLSLSKVGFIFRVSLTSALRALFKVSQLRNYSLKKFNISISDALNALFPIKFYYLKSLKNALRHSLTFSLFLKGPKLILDV